MLKKISLYLLGFCMLTICLVFGYANETKAATKLNINLKDNQVFYILPGNEYADFQVKITSGAELGNAATYMTDQVTIATIDGNGLLRMKDAGTVKVTVTANNMTISRTIKIINRTDWTKTVAIKNYEKITVQKNIGTFAISNQMDFPLRMTYTYNTYNPANAVVQTEQRSQKLYLPANTTITYKQHFADNVKYVSITDAIFEYDQFNWKKIDAKKVTISEKTSAKKNVKTIRATVTNKNKNSVIVPYQTYVYDKNGKLSSIDYAYMTLDGNQKKSIKNTYFYKKTTLDEYVSKVTYKFMPVLPAI